MKEKGLQILLADDYAPYLRLMARFLGIAGGHRVATAESGADALQKAAALTPDFILLDLFMPDMTGLEVMEKLCEDAATRHIPVGILTGASLSRGARASLGARRNFAFLEQKPAGLAGLLAKIEALAAAGAAWPELRKSEPAGGAGAGE